MAGREYVSTSDETNFWQKVKDTHGVGSSPTHFELHDGSQNLSFQWFRWLRQTAMVWWLRIVLHLMKQHRDSYWDFETMLLSGVLSTVSQGGRLAWFVRRIFVFTSFLRLRPLSSLCVTLSLHLCLSLSLCSCKPVTHRRALWTTHATF